ncbi:hypothetical protein CVT26_002086 [Gymnopilus dilepis]|uniref:Uncharacterized protein n=1 Tax=Gymnopilus dilepis TaxID=231916 RepID=A0A409VD09_9AGAR|nr:hypothetical protein CVT26_002086 [Gymnopilus dilepis]
MSPPSKPNTLLYNVSWSTRVFRSRTTTEALLSPEYEAGNLTSHDYNVSLDFLPGYHRYYPILGCVGATAVFFVRGPTARWTSRRALTAFTLGFTGYTLGNATMLKAHYDYVRSLENPAGFSKAMENVQARLGGLAPPDVAPGSHPVNQASNQAPLSKWEQIRKMNDHTAKNSSWDIIRQQHERSSPAVKSPGTYQESELFWDDAAKPDVDSAPTLS